MKNLKSIFLLAIMLIACQAVLAQTDKGIEYYNYKEDYANAVKCFQQAAEQGDPRRDLVWVYSINKA